MASKAMNLTLGILFILLAILMFIFPVGTFWVIMIIASILMMIWGIAAIVEGFENKEEMDKLMWLMTIILGFAIAILGIIIFIAAIVDPVAGAWLLAILLGIDFLLMGVFRIYAGFVNKELVSWFRVLIMVIGIIMVIFGILIFITPILAGYIVIIILGLAFIVAGVLRIILAFKEPEK